MVQDSWPELETVPSLADFVAAAAVRLQTDRGPDTKVQGALVGLLALDADGKGEWVFLPAIARGMENQLAMALRHAAEILIAHAEDLEQPRPVS